MDEIPTLNNCTLTKLYWLESYTEILREWSTISSKEQLIFFFFFFFFFHVNTLKPLVKTPELQGLEGTSRDHQVNLTAKAGTPK